MYYRDLCKTPFLLRLPDFGCKIAPAPPLTFQVNIVACAIFRSKSKTLATKASFAEVPMDGVIVHIGRAMVGAAFDAITFPWWWYTRGLRRVAGWATRTLKGWERTVGLRVWLKNLFTPMFGQTDWQGRMISFFMRLAVLVGRLLQMLFGSIAVLIMTLIYLALPPFVIWQIVLGALS